MSRKPAVTLAIPANDRLMGVIIRAMRDEGVPVVTVDLDAAKWDDAAHLRDLQAALDALPEPSVIGGFSLGARLAAMLCPRVAPLGLLCFGFPFHTAGAPESRPGLEALREVRVPTRILQGSRDPHGTEAAVRGYSLPSSVEVVWLRDGNHRFVPRARTGLTQATHIEAAVASAMSFVRDR